MDRATIVRTNVLAEDTLTKDECEKHTGYKRVSDQERWFKDRGIYCERLRTGNLIVYRDAIKLKFGALASNEAPRQDARSKINLEGI